MKKWVLVMFFIAVMSVGCARVRVEAPKEPIKVDISMRLDVYQHVTKDIDEVEDIVSGSDTPKTPGQQSRLLSLIGIAYAEEGLSPDVSDAAHRRKARRPELALLETQGVVGESKDGLLVIKRPAAGAESLVADENADRIIIYKGIAKKNGATLQEVQKMYAKRHQKHVPAGTPIQTEDGAWRIK